MNLKHPIIDYANNTLKIREKKSNNYVVVAIVTTKELQNELKRS